MQLKKGMIGSATIMRIKLIILKLKHPDEVF